MTERDFVDEEIARRTALNPDFPRLLEEAMRRQEHELDDGDEEDAEPEDAPEALS
jgi:hypothetical protein